MKNLDAILKNDRMISVHFQGKPFNITVIQDYGLAGNVEEPEVECFLWRPAKPSVINRQKKDVPFIIGDWNAKVGSENIPGVTGIFGLGV